MEVADGALLLGFVAVAPALVVEAAEVVMSEKESEKVSVTDPVAEESEGSAVT